MTGRQESLRRVLQLLRRVEGLRYVPSLDALAEEFHVHPRTIRRDLELLERVGYRVPVFRHNAERLGA